MSSRIYAVYRHFFVYDICVYVTTDVEIQEYTQDVNIFLCTVSAFMWQFVQLTLIKRESYLDNGFLHHVLLLYNN